MNKAVEEFLEQLRNDPNFRDVLGDVLDATAFHLINHPDSPVKIALEDMRAVCYVIDELLGDTDPLILEGWDDNDIKMEEPLMWCCMRLSNALAALQPEPTTKSE